MSDTHQDTIYRAAGVLADRTGVWVPDAVARMWAEPFAINRPLPDAAADLLRWPPASS